MQQYLSNALNNVIKFSGPNYTNKNVKLLLWLRDTMKDFLSLEGHGGLRKFKNLSY